jgi:hypothetical protein
MAQDALRAAKGKHRAKAYGLTIRARLEPRLCTFAFCLRAQHTGAANEKASRMRAGFLKSLGDSLYILGFFVTGLAAVAG